MEQAGSLIADKGYDSNQIEAEAKKLGMEVVIPPRKNRVNPRQYDEYLYQLRHLVENAFLKLKGWRAIATRYAKRASSYLAAVQIRCLYLWLNIS
jgi:transposase